MLGISGEASPLIIDGGWYPERDGRGYTPIYAASRTRDYTPTMIASWPGGGGSAAFVTFLCDELIPFVGGRYRANSTQRGLGGRSLGGLFATHVLLQHPGIFSRYWIAAPSLWWDAPLASYGGNKLVDEMFAASRDTLFTRKTGATQWVAVRDAKGKITALRGTLLGATQEYTRAAKR